MVDILVEAYYDGQWNDLSDDVRRDRGVTIERGQSPQARRPSPAECRIVVSNNNGKYTAGNAMSPLYRRFVQYSPIRVSIEGRQRFLGEVAEVLEDYDAKAIRTAGRTVTVVAAGIMRRLKDSSARRSSARLTLERFDPAPDAYWPLEDRELALYGRSAIPGHPAMVLRTFESVPAGGARVRFGTDDGPPGAIRAPTLDTGRLAGPVPPGPEGAWTVSAAFKMAEFEQFNNPLIIRTAPGSADQRLAIGIFSPQQEGSSLQVGMSTGGSSTTQIMTHTFTPGTFENTWHHYAITALQSGSDVFFGLWIDGVQVDSHIQGSLTMGRLSSIEHACLDVPVAVSHPAGWHSDRTDDIPRIAGSVLGYPGETAGRRIERICVEDGIPLGVIGELDDTQRMGAQTPGSALDIIQEAATAAAGVLHEPMPATRALGQFEGDTTDGWGGGGSPAPTVQVTEDQAHTGDASLEVTWGGGSGLQLIQRSSPQAIFSVGLEYTFSVWAYVPTGMPRVVPAVAGVTTGSASTLNDQWELLTVTWVATDITHSMQVWAADTTTSGDIAYVDDLIVTATMPALGFRTLASAYRRSPRAELDGTKLVKGFRPINDGLGVRNHIIVSRTHGGDVEVEADDPTLDGPLNTRAPHLGGIGRRTDPLRVNVETDRRADSRAGWELHQGIWDETRYAGIGANLARHLELIQVTSIQPLDRLTVDPPPPVLPETMEIDQVVHGWQEYATNHEWRMTLNTSPYGPLRIAITDDGESRYDSDYTTLADQLDDTSTEFRVRIEPNRARWITSAEYPGEFPLLARLGGERVEVTAIEGSASDHRPASDNDATASTSHVAPSVTPVRADAVLICAWCSHTQTGTYTVPGSMTEQDQTTGSASTMVDATEVVPDNPTGTRTATFSVADAWAATSDAFDSAAGVVVEEQLSGVAVADDVVLTTSAATKSGWFLIAIQAWDADTSGNMSAPTPGAWTLLNDTGGPTVGVSRVRTWALLTDTDGAHAVTFSGGTGDNHARLYALSGTFEQRWTVTRSDNGVVKSHDTGTKITLDKRYYVGL